MEIQPFLDSLRHWLEVAAQELAPGLSDEPRRLLEVGAYRAAVIAAITHLEISLRERLDLPLSERKRIISIREMLDSARQQGLLGKYESQQVLGWLKVRNEVVHTDAPVGSARAVEIVQGVREIVGLL